jgi:hypothetical protein
LHVVAAVPLVDIGPLVTYSCEPVEI